MKTFAIGDIHGYLKPLKQCLKRSKFDFKKDRLICLGDVADRGPETFECFELLLGIKNLVYVLGNHDYWLLEYFNNGDQAINANWFQQGGKATMISYLKNNFKYDLHKKLLEEAHLFYLDKKNRLFVHGGFEMGTYLNEQSSDDFCWDRTVWYNSITAENKIPFQLNKDCPIYTKTIFVGHSSTHKQYPDLKPQNFVNVWNLDQGAGHGGKLTIMNVKNFNYWQSDLVSSLY